MIQPTNIHSITDFRRDSNLSTRIAQDGRPHVLTEAGRPKLVVQDAAAYEKLIHALERAEYDAETQKKLCAETTPPAEATFVSLRESDRTKRDTPSPKDRPLDKVLLDCLAALSASSNGAVRLAEVREEFKRRADRGELAPEAEARVHIALGILDVAKSVGQPRKSGDESGLGVPVSQERWERIFGIKIA